MADDQRITNALTIDVEDYFQVSAFEKSIRRADWKAQPSRVVENTNRLLAILQDANVKATFYILGWVAESFPDLVRAIQDGGHEIGTHSFWHRLIYEMSPDEFREDLRKSIQVLQYVTGEEVETFRAPSFSICQSSLWALAILAEEGITSDSSIFPIVHDRYGIRNAPITPYLIETSAEKSDTRTIAEFPPTVFPLMGLRVPVSGGGYFRLYPQTLTSLLLNKINRRGRPFIFYLHPWEIDPGQPRLNVSTRMGRWRHYLNLEKTESRLRTLLTRFRFSKLSDVIDSSVAANKIVKQVNSAKQQLI